MKNNSRRFPGLASRLVPCILACATCTPLSAEEKENPDLLRFLNGDSLHGRFVGMDDGPVVKWENTRARGGIVLETDRLRRIAFNGGRANKSLTSPSYVLIDGGDRLPGRLVEMDAESLTIETEFAGTTTVPRKHLRVLAPNPHGGSVHYIGPFVDDEWKVIAPEEDEDEEKEKAAEPEVNQEEPPAADQGEEAKQALPEENEEEGPWVFSGGAYYSNGQLPIAVDTKAPDMARFQFTLAWRSRLATTIAFHATLQQPEKKAEEEDPKKDDGGRPVQRRVALGAGDNSTAGYPLTYGESYVLTIFSNYARLYRCSFNEDGNPEVDTLSASSSNLRLEESGQSEFELRCDRNEGTIALFVDGRYISQWEDTRGYAGTGSHLGFACQSSNSHLRVSDVVVTSWNGMVDSAQSMEVENRDIVLLTNGTDRFSGEVVSLKDGKVQLRGTYAEMQIPLTEIQEIRFAREDVVELPEASRDAVRLLLKPVGRLTVAPLEATRTRMKARHTALGDLDFDLHYAALLEFSFSDSILDVWDDDF